MWCAALSLNFVLFQIVRSPFFESSRKVSTADAGNIADNYAHRAYSAGSVCGGC